MLYFFVYPKKLIFLILYIAISRIKRIVKFWEIGVFWVLICKLLFYVAISIITFFCNGLLLQKTK